MHEINANSIFQPACRKALGAAAGYALFLVLGLLTLTSAQAFVPAESASESVFSDGFERGDTPYVPPQIIESEAFPSPGEFGAFDEIAILFRTGSHKPEELRLVVDGVDVSKKSTVTPQSVDLHRIKYKLNSAELERVLEVKATLGSVSFSWVANALKTDAITYLPQDGAVLPAGSRPVIGLHFAQISNRLDPTTIRIFLGGPGYENQDPALNQPGYAGSFGVDVTSRAILSERSIEYTPLSPLQNGKSFTVDFEARDQFVPETIYKMSWTFSVGPRPAITSREPAAGLLPFGSKPNIRVRVFSETYPLRSASLFYDAYDSADAGVISSLEVDTDIEYIGKSEYLVTHRTTHEFVPLRRYCYSLLATNELFLSNEDFQEETCFQVDADWAREVNVLAPEQDSLASTSNIEVRVRATASRGALRSVRIQGEVAPARYDNAQP